MDNEMTIENIEATIDAIQDSDSNNSDSIFTPYAASKLANKLLEQIFDEAEVEFKPLMPQMFYNYTTARLRKGQKPLIATTTIEGNKQVLIAYDGLVTWVTKYATKKLGFVNNENNENNEETETEQ